MNCSKDFIGIYKKDMTTKQGILQGIIDVNGTQMVNKY